MNLVFSASRYSTIVCPYCRLEYAMLDLSATDMPVCDGVEAARRIRFLENKRKVPTLLPSKCLPQYPITVTNNERSRCP